MILEWLNVRSTENTKQEEALSSQNVNRFENFNAFKKKQGNPLLLFFALFLGTPWLGAPTYFANIFAEKVRRTLSARL